MNRAPSDQPRNGKEAEETPSILEEEPDTDQAAEGGRSRAGALEELADGLKKTDKAEITVDDIVDRFEDHSIGALVSVIALISALPIVGGIPGVTIITATLMLLVIGQSLVRRRGGIWVPRWIGQRSISAEKLEKGVEKARPYLRKIDSWMYPRLEFLTRGRMRRLFMTLAVIGLTLSFYPLNFIPYAVSAPSFGVLAFGLALMTGDGYLALFGYLMMLATLGIGVVLMMGGFGGAAEGAGFVSGLFGGGEGGWLSGLFGGRLGD